MDRPLSYDRFDGTRARLYKLVVRYVVNDQILLPDHPSVFSRDGIWRYVYASNAAEAVDLARWTLSIFRPDDCFYVSEILPVKE